MINDDLHGSEDGFAEAMPPMRRSSPAAGSPSRPLGAGANDSGLADREVPVTSVSAALVNQWLDGEVGAGEVRSSPNGTGAVDLWHRINSEAMMLRSRTTPLHVQKRIMDALPEDTFREIHPWYRRTVKMNPPAVIAAGAALLGIGAALARLALR